MNLDIGKIVYVLNNNPPKLLPGKVVEQIISRKVDKEVVTHVVKFTNGKDYTLENIRKPWFPSLDSARDYLTSEAEKLIDSVVADGRKRALDHFDVVSDFGALEDTRPATKETAEIDSDNMAAPSFSSLNIPDDMIIDLGNGQKAKVKIPGALKQ